MKLPSGGQVVVVDDNYSEAKPLLDEFNRRGVPSLYFDGDLPNLPAVPLEAVRLCFLDISLKGQDGASPKTKISTLASVLARLISANNGPYVLVFWSKHEELIQDVLAACKVLGISPNIWLNLEKAIHLNADGSYDLEALQTAISTKVAETQALQLYVEWENVLRTAGAKFINDFSKLVPQTADWSKETSKLFYKLYKSYTDGKDMSEEDKFKCACILLNRSFQERLQTLTQAELKLPENFLLLNSAIDSIAIAKLNRWLFFEDHALGQSTGQVFLHTDEMLKTALQSHFKTGQVPVNIRLCKIVITPECDIAHSKTLKVGVAGQGGVQTEHVLHRIVYGLLFDSEFDPETLIKKTDAHYPVGPIWHESRHHGLILHFGTVGFDHGGNLTGQPILSLGRELLFDLQSKAANHVNRLGNYVIS